MTYYTPLPLQHGAIPIRGGAGELCWLVEGRERAALIDTGCGGKGLRELVGFLTDLPVTVLLTHGHRDHIGGVTFADAAHGVLYTGDICARRTLMMLPESQSLAVLQATLKRLKQLEQDFPIQHIGHDPAVPSEGAVDNLLDCVEDILHGRDDRIPFHNVSGSGWLAKATRDKEQLFRTDGKYGNIVYKD